MARGAALLLLPLLLRLLGSVSLPSAAWANGALLKEATPDGDFSTEYTYDADDLILTEKNAAGETWEHEYDERGHRVRTVDPAGNETK